MKEMDAFNKTVDFATYGCLPVLDTPKSIFDSHFAGQRDTRGDYYCLLTCHKEHENYAVPKDNFLQFLEIGHPLNEDESSAEFNGEYVRPMTYSEECLYNEDRLMANVDLWGNIELNDTFDQKWYLEHCI